MLYTVAGSFVSVLLLEKDYTNASIGTIIAVGSVLAILGQRETYGYEIVQALHGYGFGSVSEGTIYPLLLRLEKEGWVSARFMDSDLGPRRKYYTLTDQGRRELAQFRASFREMTAAVERLPGFGEEEMTCGSPL